MMPREDLVISAPRKPISAESSCDFVIASLKIDCALSRACERTLKLTAEKDYKN